MRQLIAVPLVSGQVADSMKYCDHPPLLAVW
jgi:hypothetical protein